MTLASLQLSSQPMLPGWMVFPMGAVGLILLAGHVMALRTAPMPKSRRRIRSFNGILMMLTIPLLSYACAGVAPAEAGAFVMAWMGSLAMVTLIGLMGVADIINTLLITRKVRAHLRAELRRTRAELRAALEARRRSGDHAFGGSERTDDAG